MMEFESSPAHHSLVVKREQMQPPLGWHHPVNLELDNTFAINGAPGTLYAHDPARHANLNQGLVNDYGNANYAWANGFASSEMGPPMGLPAQGHGFVLDTKLPAQATIAAVDLAEGIMLDNNNGRDPRTVHNAGLGERVNGIQNNSLWNQQTQTGQAFPLVPNNMKQVTAALDHGVVAFAPNVGISSALPEYSLSAQSLPNALGISEVNFPLDSTIAEALPDDESPQKEYTAITTPPSFTINYPDSQALAPYPTSSSIMNVVNSPELTGGDGDFLLSIENVLFSQDETSITQSTQSLQATQTQTQTYGLSVPMDSNSPAVTSREASVQGNWESSPRTPFGWDSSVSPSPNPQIFAMPDPPLLEGFTRVVPFGFHDGQNFSPPTFNEMIRNFDVNSQPQTKKRKRKAFNAEDKKKVNQVRENGACISCHARKIPCEVGGVCAGCIKTTGNNPTLAKEICLRTKLRDIYKSVKDIHDTLDDRQQRLIPLLESLTGEPKSVDLTVANNRLGYKFQLRLKVMKCTSSPSCRWKRLTKINGIYVTRDVIQDQRYVIVPQSLPSIEEYDNFGRQILATSNGSHSGILTQRLDEFLIGYCKHNPRSRLRDFANSTLRVASLSRLVAYGFLNLYDGSYDLLDRQTGIPITENSVSRRYVSETVHDQLRLLAAEGLEPVEKLVFAEIDNLHKVFGKVRNGRIVSGICVLRLMLLYRDRVVRDSIRLGLPRSGERHKKRLAKAEFMYKRLTIAYGTLCRESTPLIMSWEQENERDPLIEDLLMMNLFSKLQPAFEEFCTEKMTPEYDEIFKGLIIDAPRIERRPSKKRKAEKEKARITECHDHDHF